MNRLFGAFLGTLLVVFLPLTVSAAPVSSTRNISIDADSFEVDAKNNRVFTSGNVTVRQGDIVLTSQTGIYDQTGQTVTLKGKVRVQRETVQLTCDNAVAFAIQDKIEASGNVRFSYNDINGESKAAVYNRKANQVLLSGRPKVWQNRDELIGETILIDIAHSRVVTQGGAHAVFSIDKLSGR